MAYSFDPSKAKLSPYPSDFIPKDAAETVGFDRADGLDTTVRGFWLDGEFHLQAIKQELTRKK